MPGGPGAVGELVGGLDLAGGVDGEELLAGAVGAGGVGDAAEEVLAAEAVPGVQVLSGSWLVVWTWPVALTAKSCWPVPWEPRGRR